MANGKANKGKGNALVINISTLKVVFPLNSNRDKAYPAGAPIKMDSTMVMVATMIELCSALTMPENPAKNSRLATLNDGKNRLGNAITSSGVESELTIRR